MGRVCAAGKINQAAGSPVGFRCDGSRVHDLWTPRHFRPKIHYILHLAGRVSESYEGPKRARSTRAVSGVTLIELSRTTRPPLTEVRKSARAKVLDRAINARKGYSEGVSVRENSRTWKNVDVGQTRWRYRANLRWRVMVVDPKEKKRNAATVREQIIL